MSCPHLGLVALLSLPLALPLARPLAAQEPKHAGAPEAGAVIEIGSAGFVVPAGRVAPGELIDAAAEYLARNILWTEEELQNAQPFTVQRRLAVDARGCEELLGSLLATRGMVVVTIDEKKELYEVINLQGRRASEAITRAVSCTPEQILARPQLEQVVLCAVQLEHIDANVAANALRPFLYQNIGGNSITQMTVGTAGSGSTLLLRGFRTQVATCLQTLRHSDTPLSERNPELHQWQQTIQALQQQVAQPQAAVATLQQASGAGTGRPPGDGAAPASTGRD